MVASLFGERKSLCLGKVSRKFSEKPSGLTCQSRVSIKAVRSRKGWEAKTPEDSFEFEI